MLICFECSKKLLETKSFTIKKGIALAVCEKCHKLKEVISIVFDDAKRIVDTN